MRQTQRPHYRMTAFALSTQRRCFFLLKLACAGACVNTDIGLSGSSCILSSRVRDEQNRPEFDLEHLAGRSWAQAFAESLKQDQPRIRIKVSQEVSERLRQDWLLRYAEREETPDGKVILTYHGRLPSGLHFLYRFGADCEVLEPQELRARVVEEAKRVLALYAG